MGEPARANATGGSQAAGGAAVAALLVVLFMAMNLRPAFTSVGPVLADIRADLGVSSAAAALLTALPVLSLGLLAPLAPALSRRLGVERAIGAALAVLAAGLLLRVGGGLEMMLAGTIVVGGAIAVGNVLLPVIVKRDFPERAGRVTGLYSAAMAMSASAAAALTIPLGGFLGIGWRGGLALWAVPVLIALAVWLPGMRTVRAPLRLAGPGELRAMLGDPLAWQVTLYLGLQSLGFYSMIAWLPTVYRDLGMDAAQAGLLAAVIPLAAVFGSLTVPARAARADNQRIAAFLVSIGTAVGLVGIVAAPLFFPLIWVLVVGITQGAGFPLALTLVVLRTRSPEQTQHLSAMAQTVGYTLAAFGPLVMGAANDLTAGWAVPIGFLAALTILQGFIGLWAGRAGFVGGRRAGYSSPRG